MDKFSINVYVRNSLIEQLFDKWYAYCQSLDKNFQTKFDFTFSPYLSTASTNVCVLNMPDDIDVDLARYDAIIIANACEPLNVATPLMVELLKNDNVYLMANSFLTDTHLLLNKVIWMADDPLNCISYWTRSFYPNFYLNLENLARKKTKSMIAINGVNRSWRHYFLDLLTKELPNIAIKNSYGQLVETTDGQWESSEDTRFRDFVNDCYKSTLTRNAQSSYYDDSIPVGVGAKFGRIPPGYFTLDEYFDYFAIIYPESTWQNNELSITEKALKCFYTKTFPIPVGGANVNRLYNEIGFYTGWNLLPKDLQAFDSILDHDERYQELVKSISWLYQNPQVFKSDYAKLMLDQNQINFLTNKVEFKIVQRFDNFMNSVIIKK